MTLPGLLKVGDELVVPLVDKQKARERTKVSSFLKTSLRLGASERKRVHGEQQKGKGRTLLAVFFPVASIESMFLFRAACPTSPGALSLALRASAVFSFFSFGMAT